MKRLLVLLATVGLVGCATGPQGHSDASHPLVGAWDVSGAALGFTDERTDPRPEFVFREDGTYETAIGGGTKSGAYEIVGDKIIFDGMADQPLRWKRQDGQIWLELVNRNVYLPLVPHKGR